MAGHSPVFNTEGVQCFPQASKEEENAYSYTSIESQESSQQTNSNSDLNPTAQSSAAREQPSLSKRNRNRTDPTLEGQIDDNPLREFVEAVILYNCAGRNIRVATIELLELVPEVLVRIKQRPLAILTGSHAECLPGAVCSDIDMMCYHQTWPIVTFEGLGRGHATAEQGIFVAECIPEKPAFLYLRACNNTESCFDHFITEGYLSSEQFVSQFQTDASELHGPAVTSAVYPVMPSWAMTDTVPCMFSPSWPPCTAEFFSRLRPHGWPSQQLISDIQREGCHVVGKSSPNAIRPDREFRWSFSVAEKSLFHSMDDPMSACMFLLKSITKAHWKDESNPGICSYFLKMTCFWTFERLEKSSSVLSLASDALDWLITCYSVRNLPHYFIPDQNLIGNLPKDLCNAVSDKLSRIQQDLPIQAISCMDLDTKVQGLVDSLIQDNSREYRALFDCENRQLQEAIRSLLPGGSLVCQKILECMSNSLDNLSRAVRERVTNSLSETGLFSPCFPELLVAPMLQKLQLLTPNYLATNMAACVHIGLGDVYMHLAYHTNEHRDVREGFDELVTNEVVTVSSLSEISRKKDFVSGCSEETIVYPRELAEHNFRLACVPLTSPGGSTDGGFVGKVNLAKLYFMTKQWERLGQCIRPFEGSLNNNTIGRFGTILAYFPELLGHGCFAASVHKMLGNVGSKRAVYLPCNAMGATLIYRWAGIEGNNEMLVRLNTGHMAWALIAYGDCPRQSVQGMIKTLAKHLAHGDEDRVEDADHLSDTVDIATLVELAHNCDFENRFKEFERRYLGDFLSDFGVDIGADFDIPDSAHAAVDALVSAGVEESVALNCEARHKSDFDSLFNNVLREVIHSAIPSPGRVFEVMFDSAEFWSLMRPMLQPMESFLAELSQNGEGLPLPYPEPPLD